MRSLVRLSLERLLLGGLCAAGLMALASAVPRAASAQPRGAAPETPKAQIYVHPMNLRLIWNGDQGESGRGDGEVFLYTCVSWPAPVERGDPQQHTMGPLGGDREVRSGVIVEQPPGSGTFVVEPEVVVDGFDDMYVNIADCPVPTQIEVHARLWEDDSNADVLEYAKLLELAINQAADLAAKDEITKFIIEKGVDVLVSIVDWLTYSENDPLGEFRGAVTIPDPCTAPFEVERDLPLTNLAKAMMADVNAEDYHGFSFSALGIPIPDIIGTLKIKILGHTLAPGYGSSLVSSIVPPPDTARYRQIRRIDLGQPDECVVSTTLDLAGPLPRIGASADYSVYLDTDSQLGTGAPPGPGRGAEFRIQLPVGGGPALIPMLFKYDSNSGSFVPVAGAVLSAGLAPERSRLHLDVDRASLDAPAGPVSAWSVTTSSLGQSFTPPTPETLAPTVSMQSGPTGSPPVVESTYPSRDARDVPPGDSVVITFSKAMDHAAVQSAVQFTPSTPASYSWSGTTLTVHPVSPLLPGRDYTVTVQPGALDCEGAGIDGNLDRIPGDARSWSFRTAHRPLHAANRLGTRRGRFVEGDSVFARGLEFPVGTTVNVHVMQHLNGRIPTGSSLSDVTTDGVNVAVTDGLGALPLTHLGRVLTEGEYHVVVDVDRNGLFDPNVDRVDRSSIGFAVAQSAVDGRLDPSCVTPVASQAVQTGFGDNALGLQDFANGSELDGACVSFSGRTMKLFLTGNLESNFNNVELFFDTRPGGQNRLRGDNSSIDFGGLNRMGDDGSGNGFTFDQGFGADYWLGLTGGDVGGGKYAMFVNQAELLDQGTGPGRYLGTAGAAGDGRLEDGEAELGIRVALDNSNIAGVSAGCNAANGQNVPTGIELNVPLSALGEPEGCIKVLAFVNGSEHAFVSNQFLGPLPQGTCNLGEPRAVNLANIPGAQSFTVCVPARLDVPGSTDSRIAGVAAWPTPFRSNVNVMFSAAKGKIATVEVFDLLGRRIRTIGPSLMETGLVIWDGAMQDGQRAPAGIYLVRARGTGFQQNTRVLKLN